MATEPESANQCGHCVRQKEDFSPIWRPFLELVRSGSDPFPQGRGPLANPLYGVYFCSFQDDPGRVSDFHKVARAISAKHRLGLIVECPGLGVHDGTDLVIAYAAEPSL
jgi:hypothetical protein